MNTGTFLLIIGAGLCGAVLFYNKADDRIPKGHIDFKLKNTNGMEDLFAQIKDLGLTRYEVEKVTKIGMASAKPGAIALSLDSNDPHYSFTFGGMTLRFIHGVMTPFEFLQRNGMVICNIDRNIIKCRSTLDNGYVSQTELIFNYTTVNLIRVTDYSKVQLSMVKV
ncbi:hypothetical protein Ocin01_18737 [Orchesella cincta]|uniref:Uncharacterized protein n=1 Tax=Orchesella cincta TaxID=48709 RepID=A0A1D2M4P3_ORCCI|nr:hypothetical protein Ocin01_18737 [Orchesella cincta]